MSLNDEKQSAADFAERVRVNQQKLKSNLKAQYDFIDCCSGSCVVCCLCLNVGSPSLESAGCAERSI
jgi:hypothetical protein